MRTPIADFIVNYAERHATRLHMPGHKGKTFIGCEVFDITEIKGADVLYHADGIIAESEDNCTSLFGTAHSFYSTEGSSLAIKAMLSLAVTASCEEKPYFTAISRIRSFVSRISSVALASRLPAAYDFGVIPVISWNMQEQYHGE